MVPAPLKHGDALTVWIYQKRSVENNGRLADLVSRYSKVSTSRAGAAVRPQPHRRRPSRLYRISMFRHVLLK